MSINQTVTDFRNYMERISMFHQAMGIIYFDASTVAPKGGVEQRAKRSGFFGLEIHNMYISDTMKKFLDDLAPELQNLDQDIKAMHRIVKKRYDSATKIPPDLVKAFAELRAEANAVWETAKQNNDFKAFAPYLVRLVEMKKKTLEYRTDEIPKGGVPYDVLLDDFEEDMTVEKYDKFFGGLKEIVVPLIKKVLASEKKIDTSFVNLKVDVETQRRISAFIAEKVGYDLSRGYICEAEHPFCAGADSTDVRITTHYYEDDFMSSLYSVLHECGHGIYEQGVGEDIAGTYLGSGGSSGLHESQSRFIENILGRSLTFWESITDELKAILPKEFSHVTPQMFFEASNIVKNSLIRIEADELTYSLHVILRYEIEKMLFSGSCTVDELPAIWNQKYQDYLGITPPTDTLGVLQDIHWSEALFGYFPTYALGSAYAAQFYSYMQKDFDVDAAMRKGEFVKIKNWLGEKIHKHGTLFTTDQIMQKEFGELLDVKYFAKYLNDKYSAIYELN